MAGAERDAPVDAGLARRGAVRPRRHAAGSATPPEAPRRRKRHAAGSATPPDAGGRTSASKKSPQRELRALLALAGPAGGGSWSGRPSEALAASGAAEGERAPSEG
ncbi:hypothetical protein [Paenibacillus sp. J31TS4]|uniref:hypothetical protein n=1 Tax=Paenibacillus sp. J31TS4 TaxID=2807195 RepID=UPI001BCE6ABB|nr:hypothetical protein [Paenibacillus sp. J31TS4]